MNIKRGQFVAPHDMVHAVEKARHFGAAGVMLTERGTSFGYNDLIVDMRGLVTMRSFAPVCFDATHAVQFPGGSRGPRPRWASTRSSSRFMRTPTARRATASASFAPSSSIGCWARSAPSGPRSSPESENRFSPLRSRWTQRSIAIRGATRAKPPPLP
jgi:hypothetical protein